MFLRPDERRTKLLVDSLLSRLRDLALAIQSLKDEKGCSHTQTEIATRKDNVPPPAGTLRAIADRLDALVIKQESDSKETKTFQRKTLHVQWWLFGATAAAFVTAGIYAYIADLQKDTMNRTLAEVRKQTRFSEISARSASDAAKAAHDNFRTEQRPYMIAETPAFVQGRTPAIGTVPRANITMRNIGKTPALNESAYFLFVRFNAPTASSKEPANEIRRFIDEQIGILRSDATKQYSAKDLGRTMFYRRDYAPTVSSFSSTDLAGGQITAVEMPRIVTGDLSLFYVGLLRYQDSFGDPILETEFCWQYFGIDATTWHYCPTHNQIK